MLLQKTAYWYPEFKLIFKLKSKFINKIKNNIAKQ